MYGLEITIEPKDLALLSSMKRKIVFSKPPSYRPDVDETRWTNWLVWASVPPKPLIRVYWEPRYRIFASELKPNPYREMDLAGCMFTSADVYDQTMLYTLTDYYCMTGGAIGPGLGVKGEYYARNMSGRNGMYLGMAQAVDLLGDRSYRYLPIDATALLNGDMATFVPFDRVTVFMRQDERTLLRRAGVGTVPLHLNYEGAQEGTVYKVRYSLEANRFEQLL